MINPGGIGVRHCHPETLGAELLADVLADRHGCVA
jgi:hypothetical protein